jgi:FixJ family two-component response regulator
MVRKLSCVYVVDDDPSMRKGLQRLLKSLNVKTQAFASAEEFLEADIETDAPSCLILDIRMPGLTGMELQEALVTQDYCMPIIFITGHGDVSMSVKAMKNGAVDFLPKPFNDQDLIDAIYQALEKDKKARKKSSDTAKIQCLVDSLTPREYEVLQYLITGMLNKQIARALNASEKTIKIHRGRVMEKMEVASVAELVRLTGKVDISPASASLR